MVQAERKAAPQVLLSARCSRGLSWVENVVTAHSTLWKSIEPVEMFFQLLWNTCGISNGDGQCVWKAVAALVLLCVRRGSEEWRRGRYSVICAVKGHHLGGAAAGLRQFGAVVFLTCALVPFGVAAGHFHLI